MWPFSSPKEPTQLSLEQYETLSKRWIDVDARISRLELNEESFRDKVLRKIQKPKEQTEELNTNRPGIIGYGTNPGSLSSSIEK
jgi:hypothetical protein